mmetsp:Transcript_28058/g.74205  ORF Transcript_28058/g.74205 Transcript_28058/m.74205 type:complete len:217 (+) Transcript_28058:858-1508(+)
MPMSRIKRRWAVDVAESVNCVFWPMACSVGLMHQSGEPWQMLQASSWMRRRPTLISESIRNVLPSEKSWARCSELQLSDESKNSELMWTDTCSATFNALAAVSMASRTWACHHPGLITRKFRIPFRMSSVMALCRAPLSMPASPKMFTPMAGQPSGVRWQRLMLTCWPSQGKVGHCTGSRPWMKVWKPSNVEVVVSPGYHSGCSWMPCVIAHRTAV